MEQVHQFSGLKLGGKTSGSEGIIKINNHGIGWKNKAGASETFEGSNIESASWIKILRSMWELEIILKNGSVIKFDGFREQDFEALQKILKMNFDLDLKLIELATKGINWGESHFQGNSMFFNIEGKRAFEIPLTDVSRSVLHTTVGSKNDVSVEFHQDDIANDEADNLVEIRFHFPSGDDQKISAQSFVEKVSSKADIASTTGKGIIFFDKVLLLTPRGRFTIEMFPTFMKLHGKTNDYKILYNHVSRIFQLPKTDQSHIYFVISLDPPIKQGQTKYLHLVLLFPKDETIEVPVNLSKENAEKYKDLLPNEGGKIKGKAYDVVSKAFKTLLAKKITIPNNFKSASSTSAIKCSLKANSGFLYPLERSFFFVHKPPTHIRFDDIEAIEFSRVSSSNSSSNRTFDLLISVKNSGAFQFTGIQRAEYSNLYNFISGKKLTIKLVSSMESEPNSVLKEIVQEDSDEDDDDFVGGEEDDVPEDFEEDEEDEDFHVDESKEKNSSTEKKRKSDSPGSKEVKESKKSKKDKKDKKDKNDKKEKKDKKDKKDKKEKKE